MESQFFSAKTSTMFLIRSFFCFVRGAVHSCPTMVMSCHILWDPTWLSSFRKPYRSTSLQCPPQNLHCHVDAEQLVMVPLMIPSVVAILTSNEIFFFSLVRVIFASFHSSHNFQLNKFQCLLLRNKAQQHCCLLAALNLGKILIP